jgi:hypothetical protein
MAGRGPQSYKKRQKEQKRKERQDEKRARRLQRKQEGPLPQDDTQPEDLAITEGTIRHGTGPRLLTGTRDCTMRRYGAAWIPSPSLRIACRPFLHPNDTE